MPPAKLLIIFLLSCAGCKSKSSRQQEKFDIAKWGTKQDKEYPYRDKMLTDFMTNYKLNGVKKDSVLNLLGQPDRSDSGYLFYTVAQTFFPNTSWPLSTKSLVIKLTKDGTVEWRKIHE